MAPSEPTLRSSMGINEHHKDESVTLEKSISGPIAVIGDVHGQVEQLARVLEQIESLPDYERRWVVFIGDLVDRGPNPKAAIDLMLQQFERHSKTTIICGNHELAMAASIQAIPTPEYSDWAGRWVDHYDSDTTFSSYGVEFGDLDGLREQVPESHLQLLAEMPWCVEHPEYFFVHAGLMPHTPFALQRDILMTRDFTLNRPDWLCSKSLPFEGPPHDCTHTVVSGHVRVPEVRFGKRRILIDTTGGHGGSLSCVLLPENRVIESDPSQRKSSNRTRKRGWFW